MVHPGHDFPQRIFELIRNAVSTVLLIVLFYTLQYIFDMDFMCSCKPGVHLNGILYMLAPPVILVSVLNIIESFYQRGFLSRWQSLCHNNRCFCCFKFLIHYLSLTAVWIATVLFDGDWYFCLKTNLNATHTGIPCKEKLSYEEYLIKAEHKTASLVSNNTQQICKIKPNPFEKWKFFISLFSGILSMKTLTCWSNN